MRRRDCMRNLDTPLVCNNEETPADDNKERILGCRAIVQCTAGTRLDQACAQSGKSYW